MNIFSFGNQRRTKQIISLYSSLTFGILISICVSVINTRLLGPKQYGDLKFLQNMFIFISTFLTLGIFVSGARLLASKENEKIKRQLIGSLYILASIISVVLIIIVFIFSFFEEQIFNNKLGLIIRVFSPLLFVFPFQLCLQNIMQGDNKIYALSIFNIAPRILYIIMVLVISLLTHISLTYVLGIQFLSLAILIFVMAIHFKPEFINFKKISSIIWQENKTYGLQVYIGMLVGVASAQLAGLSIGYFIDNTNVGFFSLALTSTMPLTMIPSAVGITFFKDFANSSSIPKRATLVTIILSLIGLFIFLLFIEKVILLLYTSEYLPVVSLAYLVSFGSILHGFGDYINKFLGAHGKGKALRNGAIVVGFSNIIGYIVLVRMIGVKGAAITKIISGLTYCVMMLYFYRYFRKNYRKNDGNLLV